MLQPYGRWTLWLCSASLLMLSLVNSHKEHCLSTAPGLASWFSFTWSCKACGVRKFSEQNGHWLTCVLVCTLSLVIVLNSLLQSLHLITLSLCSPKCCKYSEYWINGWVQNGQAKIVCSPGCSWLMCSVSFHLCGTPYHNTYIPLCQLTALPSSSLPKLHPLGSQPCALYHFSYPPVLSIASHSRILRVALHL